MLELRRGQTLLTRRASRFRLLPVLAASGVVLIACKDPIFPPCVDGCQAWGERCGGDADYCAVYCDDPSYAGGVTGCTESVEDTGLGLPLSTYCDIVTECIDDCAETYVR